jgi:hypothetical protein
VLGTGGVTTGGVTTGGITTGGVTTGGGVTNTGGLAGVTVSSPPPPPQADKTEPNKTIDMTFFII